MIEADITQYSVPTKYRKFLQVNYGFKQLKWTFVKGFNMIFVLYTISLHQKEF